MRSPLNPPANPSPCILQVSGCFNEDHPGANGSPGILCVNIGTHPQDPVTEVLFLLPPDHMGKVKVYDSYLHAVGRKKSASRGTRRTNCSPWLKIRLRSIYDQAKTLYDALPTSKAGYCHPALLAGQAGNR